MEPIELHGISLTICETVDAATRMLLRSQPSLLISNQDFAEDVLQLIEDTGLTIPCYIILPNKLWSTETIRYWSAKGVHDVWCEDTWKEDLQAVISIETRDVRQEKIKSRFPKLMIQSQERIVEERRTQVVLCAGLHSRAGTTSMTVNMAMLLAEKGPVALLEHPDLEHPFLKMWLGEHHNNIVFSPPNPLSYRHVIVDVGTHFDDPWTKGWIEQAGLILLAAECDLLLMEWLFTQEVSLNKLEYLRPFQRQLHLVLARGYDHSIPLEVNTHFPFAGVHYGITLPQKEVMEAYTEQVAPWKGKSSQKQKKLFEELASILEPNTSKKKAFRWLGY